MPEFPFLKKVREENPLVHCLTNMVVANFQANGLLAIGASPVMADAVEEAGKMTAHADATILNIGTLKKDSLDAMLIAGQRANEKGTPVVLDPVGAGATAFRSQSVKTILKEVNVSLIRCNAGELATIAGVEWHARGVDAGDGEVDIAKIAKKVASTYQCLVAVTGEVDFVTDGDRINKITGGHPLMAKVTGTGCLLSSVAGAFLAVSENLQLKAVTEALTFYKKAGERASKEAIAPGTFQIRFLDELYLIQP